MPFFQPPSYAPTGSFADASAWPSVLPTACPEASAASVNDDPVLNQSGIDLGSTVDRALGWRWPSSGFVAVNVARRLRAAARRYGGSLGGRALRAAILCL
jgi:hypothetical protein